MRRYGQLTDAIARHGGPQNLAAGSSEATWLEGQQLAHHRGKLPDGKIALLEQAGIQVRRPDPWLACYQVLMAFKAQHGHLNVPDKYKIRGSLDLSDWMRDQAVRRKADRITDEQVRLLDQAGFCWDPSPKPGTPATAKPPPGSGNTATSASRASTPSGNGCTGSRRTTDRAGSPKTGPGSCATSVP